MQSELTERRCNKEIFNSGVKNVQNLKSPSRSLRCVSAVEDQTEEQYSRQGRIKEMKHLIKPFDDQKSYKTFGEQMSLLKCFTSFILPCLEYCILLFGLLLLIHILNFLTETLGVVNV